MAENELGGVADATQAPAPLTEKISGDKVKDIVAAIKEATDMPAFRLVIDPDRTPTLTETKFGGLPYWPVGQAYPRTPKGRPLMLLAQLDLADFGGDTRLPDHGLLQFFIDAEDDCSGMDFDDSTNQSGFRVVWHQEVDASVTAEQVEALDIPTSRMGLDEDYLGNPLAGEFALHVEPTICGMTIADGRFDKVFVDCCESLFGKEFVGGRTSCWDLLEDEDVDRLFDELKTPEPAHLVLGYPFFTQNDPRLGALMDEFDTLLLQIDSEGEPGSNRDRIIWGDVGIGGFFVNSEALRRGDFSRVLFNWDCY